MGIKERGGWRIRDEGKQNEQALEQPFRKREGKSKKVQICCRDDEKLIFDQWEEKEDEKA